MNLTPEQIRRAIEHIFGARYVLTGPERDDARHLYRLTCLEPWKAPRSFAICQWPSDPGAYLLTPGSRWPSLRLMEQVEYASEVAGET